MEYRKEVDGLRAVAVIPVIFFHAGFEAFAGGFVGVDVFFVISGYLITSIILAEKENGTFSIIRFYERRARRILPALFVVILSCLPFAWLWLTPTHLEDFSQSVWAVSLFSSNVLFWLERGYFGTAAELKPLLHTWSLAVEEQYYVLFPLFLSLVWWLRRRWIFAAIIILGVVSLGLAEWGVQRWPSATFFLLPTRAWELMIGACVALLIIYGKQPSELVAEYRIASELAGFVGLAMIAWSVFLFDESVPFPSFYALVPTIGTALIIQFSSTRTLVGRMLATRHLVSIGLISYSAYLWHQPLFVFARHRSLTEPGAFVFLALSVLTMLLAYLSWRYVEKPFRKRGLFGRQFVFASAFAGSVLLAGIGVAGHMTDGFEARLPRNVADNLWQATADTRRQEKPCLDVETGLDLPVGTCVRTRHTMARVFLVGDSHAGALAEELGLALADKGIGLLSRIRNACPPFAGVIRIARHDREDCAKFNTDTWTFMMSAKSPEYVVFATRWALNLEGSRFDNGEGGKEHGKEPVLGRRTDGRYEDLGYDEVQAVYSRSIVTLLEAGKKVVLVYPIPEMGWNVPEYLGRWSLIRDKDFAHRPALASTDHARFLERNDGVYAALNDIPQQTNLMRVLPEEAFCDHVVEGRCVGHLDGVILYEDDDHLSDAGARIVVDSIVRSIGDQGH